MKSLRDLMKDEQNYLSAVVTLTVGDGCYERTSVLNYIFDTLSNEGYEIEEENDESTYSLSFSQRNEKGKLVDSLRRLKKEVDNECGQIEHITIYIATAKDRMAAIERIEI